MPNGMVYPKRKIYYVFFESVVAATGYTISLGSCGNYILSLGGFWIGTVALLVMVGMIGLRP
jgi:hypothetical protein